MKEWVSFLRTGYTLGREKGEGLLKILQVPFSASYTEKRGSPKRWIMGRSKYKLRHLLLGGVSRF